MKDKSRFSPKGAKIVAALGRFGDTIEVGVPIEQRYTVRRVKLDLPTRLFGPDEVKGIRAMMGVSQPIFGQFLGPRPQSASLVAIRQPQTTKSGEPFR